MTSASKLAIVDRLLPLLEAFGASRLRQTGLRREMREAGCTHEEALQPTDDNNLRLTPCYGPDGRTPWCEACRRHDAAFHRLLAERKANKARLLRIEKLAVRFAAPDPPEPPPEPKVLLTLMEDA